MNGIGLKRETGIEPTLAMSRSIRRSWARCARLDEALEDEPRTLSRGDLHDRFEQHACVMQAAQPEIETLAGMVAGASSLVLLADATGVILHATGNSAFLRRADQVALRPGVSWAENHRGTNAIGTALVDEAALRVHGEEHYMPRNQILSCHASPIRSPRGDILGVLDISGDAGRLHAYALGLASMFARQVTNRVIERSASHCMHLVFHKQAALLDTAERGMLLIEDGQIVGANDAAVALLGTQWVRLLDQPVEACLPTWKTLTQTPTCVHTEEGVSVYALLLLAPRGVRLDRLRDRDRRTGSTDLPDQNLPAYSETPGDGVATHTPIAHQPPSKLPTLAATLQPGMERARRAIDGGLSVLLQGETGTGKEVYARHLHQKSVWRQGPFVAVNCGALPESLIEAELFGYEAGAYTGARRQGAPGRLREAHGGLLFLDEIGDMPLALQTRLLRVLQERRVQPLGSDKSVAINVGVVSATNRDLDTMIEKGQFRADLFYRLHDYGVKLPTLKTREDLRTLICAQLREYAHQRASLTLTDDALNALATYEWPGNYRQLQSVLKGLSLFYPPGSLIRLDQLPPDIVSNKKWPMPSATPTWGLETDSGCKAASGAQRDMAEEHKQASVAAPGLKEMQAQRIEQALAHHKGRVAPAANDLGIHRSTIYRHIAQRTH